MLRIIKLIKKKLFSNVGNAAHFSSFTHTRTRRYKDLISSNNEFIVALDDAENKKDT